MVLIFRLFCRRLKLGGIEWSWIARLNGTFQFTFPFFTIKWENEKIRNTSLKIIWYACGACVIGTLKLVFDRVSIFMHDPFFSSSAFSFSKNGDFKKSFVGSFLLPISFLESQECFFSLVSIAQFLPPPHTSSLYMGSIVDRFHHQGTTARCLFS